MKDFHSITITVKKNDAVTHQVTLAELGRIPYLEAHKFIFHFEGVDKEAALNHELNLERET